MENKNQANAMETIASIILFVLIMGGIYYFAIMKPTKDSETEFVKRTMLSAVQKHSYKTLTVEDINIIETIEKTKTLEIYKVSVSKSDFDIRGNFYVALSKPDGVVTDTVFLDSDLNKLRKAVNE